jgi:hypothetical protein
VRKSSEEAVKAWHLVVIILVGGIFLMTRPPSGEKIAREMSVDVEEGTISYAGVTYTAKWGRSESRQGDVRHVIRAYDKIVPVVIFHIVLTTGEFSDPDVVALDHNGGGNYIWRSKKKPEGTLIVLHLVPESDIVFRALRGLDDGDTVEIVGRDETRGSIEADSGAFLRLRHSNHKFVLVSKVVVRSS